MSAPQVVAVGGGKGGVGKSLLAANLGIFLATLGKRVTVIDTALGTPNLHLFCGVPRPSRTLAEAVTGSASLSELAVSTPVAGMRLVAGAADPAWIADVGVSVVQELLQQARTLPCDWVVLDLGPGMNAGVLELFLGADVGIVTAVADPTSVELMHRFMRAVFLHRLRQLGLGELADRADLAASPRARDGGIVGPLDLYLGAVESGDEYVEHLRAAIRSFAPQLVINAARSKHDMELGRAIASAARRRLAVPLGYLGHLEYDEAVWASTRRRRPLLVEHPEARITKCIEKVTRGLLAVRPPNVEGDVLPSDSHYDLLEVAPTASFEDIRRANRRIRDIYGAESIAIAGLYDPAGLEAVHRRLDLAYTTLMDAAKRKEYDQELFPDGIPMPVAPPTVPAGDLPRVERAEVPVALRPPMPELGPRTEYSGATLRQVREALGIELREVAERSKIGIAYLQSLESDAYGRLPAPVYVRGFLTEYARILGLDPERVKDTYLERYRAARPPSDNERAARDEGSGLIRRKQREAPE